jgi:prevent-host-death family protein
MRMITATEANREFSKLLEQVENGDTVNITKHGKIVASIVPGTKAIAEMQKGKAALLKKLLLQKPIPGLTRGTRDELYDDVI